MFGIPDSLGIPIVGVVATWIVCATAAVVFYTGALKGVHKVFKKRKDLATAFGVITAVLLLGSTATLAPVGGGGDDEPLAIEDCSLVTPDVDLNSLNRFSPGTALTGDSAWRKLGLSGWTTSAVGTELTNLEKKTTYEYISGTDASTDHTGEDFCAPITFTTKCQEEEIIELDCVADEDATGLSATFYNADKAASAQAISTSETKSVFIKFQAGSNEVYGNPFTPGAMPNILVLHLNTTGYSVPEDVWVEEGKDVASNANLYGTKLTAVGCPSVVTSAAGYSNYCYKAPAVSEDTMMIGAKLVAKAVDNGNDETAYFLAGGVYIDSLTNAVGYGVEDELGNAVGTGSAATWENVTINMS